MIIKMLDSYVNNSVVVNSLYENVQLLKDHSHDDQFVYISVIYCLLGCGLYLLGDMFMSLLLYLVLRPLLGLKTHTEVLKNDIKNLEKEIWKKNEEVKKLKDTESDYQTNIKDLEIYNKKIINENSELKYSLELTTWQRDSLVNLVEETLSPKFKTHHTYVQNLIEDHYKKMATLPENKDRLILKIYTIKPPKRTAALVSRKKTREIFEQETGSDSDSDSDSSSTNKKHKKC